MKRLWLALLLFTAGPLYAKGTEQELHLSDFHCGVDTYHSSLTLPDCFVQDALNVYFDKVAGATKRSGYTVFASSKSYSFTGLWSYTDTSNNVWMIARSSDTLIATTGVGTSNFNIKIATVSANDVVGEVNAFGNAYFVDPTQGVYFWNGTATTFVSGSPKGSLITQFHQRVWVGGQASPNQNVINGSKFQDGQTWALGSFASDPVQFTVGLQDNFDKLTAFFPGYNDTLYIFKNYSINGLFGFDQTDFQVRAITLETGCIDQGSLQPFIGGLVFASPRGIEYFDGYTPTRISDSIKNKVDPVTLNSSFNQTSWTQSSQSDWNAGTFGSNGPTSGLSSTISPPTLVLSTGVYTDSTTANFSIGSMNLGIDTTTLPNTVTLRNISESFANNTNWTTTNGTYSVNPLSCASGACNQKYTDTSKTVSGNFLIQFDFNSQGGCSYSHSVALLNASGNGHGIYLTNNPSHTTLRMFSGSVTGWNDTATNPLGSNVVDAATCDANWHTIQVLHDNLSGGTSAYYDGTLENTATDASYKEPFNQIRMSDSEAGPKMLFRNLFYTATTGNFSSRIIDTGFFSPAWGTFTSGSNGLGTVTYGMRVSSASASVYTADVLITTGATPSVSNKRFFIITSTLTATTVAGVPQITSLSIPYEASTGVWTSQCHSILGITSFGNLAVTQDQSTAGTIAFNVCTSASSNCSAPTCTVVGANSQITTPTNSFADVIASFSVVTATNVPVQNSFTVGWFSGTKKPPMASAVYDNRYWLSITTNTADAQNDATLVLAKGPVWTIFDIKAGAFTLWKNSLYHADALATGNVYLQNQGFADNGVAINAYLTTKDYSPESIIYDKYFDSLYLIADNLGNYNIYPTYQIDKSGTFLALGNPVQNELIGEMISKLPMPIDSAHQVFGKTIAFKFQQNDVNAPMQIFGGIVLYKWRPPQ